MGTLERRYAEALLSLTESAAQADEVGMSLGNLGKLFSQNSDLREFILNPSVPNHVRAETLSDILDMLRGDGGKAESGEDAGVLLSRFLRLLLDKGRLAFLPTISDEYDAIKAAHRNVLRILVRSSAPLDDKTLGGFREKYREQYGASEAEIVNTVEPSLLGGVSVQIGDVRIDDTLYGRLASLARTITAGATPYVE
jgi:F-type H+-transporting ATPase subunit delta